MMAHRNSGTSMNGAPSLFGEAPADASGKTLSILSAVTGREVAGPVRRSTPTPSRSIMLLMLLLAGVLGFAFWQHGDSGLAAKRLEPAAPLQPGRRVAENETDKPVMTQPTEAAGRHAGSAAEPRTDAAIIETLAEPFTPSAVNAQATHTPGIADAPPAVETAVAREDMQQPAPALALTPALDLAPKKAAGQERTGAAARRASPTPQPQSPARPEAPQRQQASVAKSGVDPDEKLLEEMLRLIKKDAAREAVGKTSSR